MLGLLLAGSGAVIALLIPDAPLSYAFLRNTVSVVGAVVPAVDRIGEQSPISEVAQTYWAVMWIWSLLWLPLFFMLTDEQVRPLGAARRRPWIYRFSPLIVILVLAYMLFAPFRGGVLEGMLGSRWGLAILGSVLFASVPLFIRACFTWYRYLPLLDSPSSDAGR